MRRFAVPLMFLCLSTHTPGYGQENRDSSFKQRVQAISVGADSNERRKVITSQLEKMGIGYELQAFTWKGQSGTNILLTLPVEGISGEEILLGAHYDKVPLGQGAVDNASGVSVVMELLTSFQDAPIKKGRLSAAFFDQEEQGMGGSRAFLEVCKVKSCPKVFFNFDVFGYGDTLCVVSKDNKSKTAKAIIQAASGTLPIYMTSDFPPSDHQPFFAAGIETLGMALLDAQEIEPILKNRRLGKLENPPRLATILHTPKDTPDEVSGTDAARALQVIEKAIRFLVEN